MKHDELFKQVLRKFFAEFMELFLPGISCRINARSAQFVDKELLPAIGIKRTRVADFVAIVPVEHETEKVIVHIEIELRKRKGFSERMFRYYCRLWEDWKCGIIPVVLYLRSGSGLSMEQHVHTALGDDVMSFQYRAIGLAGMRAVEYAYQGQKNVLGWTLASLMRKPRDVMQALKLRAECLRAIIESDYSEEDKLLLWNVVETYWELSPEDRVKFEKLIATEPYREVSRMQMTWVDKLVQQGRREGREEGLQEGILEGRRAALLHLLRCKFRKLPAHVKTKVQQIDSTEVLDELLAKVLTAESLADVGINGLAVKQAMSRRKVNKRKSTSRKAQ